MFVYILYMHIVVFTNIVPIIITIIYYYCYQIMINMIYLYNTRTESMSITRGCCTPDLVATAFITLRRFL